MQADFLFAVNFCINGLCAVHTASEVIDMKKLEMALLLGMAGTILWNSWNGFTADWNHLQQNVLRMHILANSDSPADQALKLEVRDRLLASSEELFGEEIDFDHWKKPYPGSWGALKHWQKKCSQKMGLPIRFLRNWSTCRLMPEPMGN